MFCREHGHHRLSDYGLRRTPSDDELIVYTWYPTLPLFIFPVLRMDVTLRELASLVMEVHEESRRSETRFSLCLVSVDPTRGSFRSKPLGSVHVDPRSMKKGQRSEEEEQSLADVGFEIGDYVDVAICFGPSLGFDPRMQQELPRAAMDQVRQRPGGRVQRLAPPPSQ